MEHIKQLRRDFVEQAIKRGAELSEEISRCDLIISDVMHFLELEKVDAVDMVKAAKIIKETRQIRRVAKIEQDQVHSTLSVLGKNHIEKLEQKKYTYKTKAMDDVCCRRKQKK